MKRFYFWFSTKQLRALLECAQHSGQEHHPMMADLDSGFTAEYTECNQANKPHGFRDDYRYLGTGTIRGWR